MDFEFRRTKKSLTRLIFSRIGVIALLVVFQAWVLVYSVLWLGENFQYASGLFVLISAFIAVYIINRNDSPAYRLAWMPIVLLFPVLGGLFYLFVRTNRITRWVKKRVHELENRTKHLLPWNEDVQNKLQDENEQLYRMGKYINNVCGLSVYDGSDVKYLAMGEEKFEELLKHLKMAEKFIFMEYFIIADGYMWSSVLSVLEEKASQGVEVRVMYDGMGSLGRVPHGYEKVLKGKGIKAKVFMPASPILSTVQNNRDHRKIVVIDGKCAFNGGVNIADEYINIESPYGKWKDTAVMVTGEAVKSYTAMFLQMWNIDERCSEPYERYIAESQREEKQGYVCAYGDNPLDSEWVGKNVYCHVLNNSSRYVHIMTPYFLPDDEIINALCNAAKSGVDVKIILPHIPDKKTPFFMAQSYYPLMLSSGIKIYEYKPGFIHAKTMVSDNECAVVGTVNFDYRSFYLHFECGTYFENMPAVDDVEKDFQSTLDECIEVTEEYYKNLPVITKTWGWFLRIFAPLM